MDKLPELTDGFAGPQSSERSESGECFERNHPLTKRGLGFRESTA
jgi:hypothetical protein